jgi:hypothetical protein
MLRSWHVKIGLLLLWAVLSGVLACFFFFGAYHGLTSGHVTFPSRMGRAHHVVRDLHPALFWVLVSTHVVLGGLFGYSGYDTLRKMLKSS